MTNWSSNLTAKEVDAVGLHILACVEDYEPSDWLQLLYELAGEEKFKKMARELAMTDEEMGMEREIAR